MMGGLVVDAPPELPQPAPRAFPTTQVSLVQLAARPGAEGFQEAWGRFFRAYWGPLHAYLVRTGSTPDDALDLLQDFFIDGTHGTILKGYDPARGRLRTYLLACLKNLRRKAIRRDVRRPDRRAYAFLDGDDGSASGRLPAVAPAAAGAAGADPEEAFEDEWVRVLCQRTVDAVRARLDAAGDAAGLALLDRWVLVLAPERPAAEDLAQELGIKAGALYTRATRLRAALVKEATSQAAVYAGSPRELTSERDAVLRVFRGEAAS